MRMIGLFPGAFERINALNATIRRHSLSGSDITAESVIVFDALTPDKNLNSFQLYASSPVLPGLELPGSQESEDEKEDKYDEASSSSGDESLTLGDEYSDAYSSLGFSMASSSVPQENLSGAESPEATRGDPGAPESSELAYVSGDAPSDPLQDNRAADDAEVPARMQPQDSEPTETSAQHEEEYHSEMVAETPPMALVEPEVPDPFVVDDGEDDSDEEDEETGSAQEGDGISEDGGGTPDAADEIALAQSTIIEPPPSEPAAGSSSDADASQAPIQAPLLSVNKDVPAIPQPVSDEDEEDEEPPELYLPGLILPTMFLPIPNTDPLTSLLIKYIPPERRPARDISGEWQRSDFHTLVMTNSWRALARMARDRLVGTNPEDVPLILSLWYIRLSSLARLRLFNQTSAECTNLFTVLNGIEPPATREWVFERLLPFELEVLQAKTKYWAGDHMGYLDALVGLLRRSKTRARQAGARRDTVAHAMWKERGARLCLIIASQLIEMKDYTAAARLLEPLCTQSDGSSSPHIHSAVARIYLQGGHIAAAIRHFSVVAQDAAAEPSLKAMNAALLAAAEGDWDKANNALRQIMKNDPENYVAVNNLAVVLLSQGMLKEGIEILETALRASPSTIVVAEPFLFNLSTLYELRSNTAAEKKRELLVEVAKWAGDGLRTACLKMPTN